MSSEKQDSQNKFDIAKIKAQLKKWQERLLDLSKGNSLLGINRSRVSKLLIKQPETNSLFNAVVIDEGALKLPFVTKKKKRKKEEDSEVGNEEDAEPEYVIHPGDIEFDSQPKNLIKMLRRIYDNGRTTMEERGVTTLHLTFGILNWDDPILEESSSPLILVPCQLENRGPNSHMQLKMLDEEIQVNPAVELYLRQKHHITLPTFPDDEERTVESLKIFLNQVRKLVNEQHWQVKDECWLSTFSFESLVIYKDLEAMAEIAYQNPIIAALARARDIWEKSETLGEDLDELDTPKEVPVAVATADASQLRALAVAASGKHLVVHGPPGTGKSQTITNLIADALGKGKKVLFVSAKMAALDVVHDRLVKLGLERFCLEAHSTKAGKAKIIEELKRTIELPINNGGGHLEEQVEELIKLRTQLNSYVKEIHEPRQPLGKTIYQAVGTFEKLFNIPRIDFDLPWSDVAGVSREQLRENIESLEELAVQSEIFDGRLAHPWRGFSNDGKQTIKSDSIKKNLQTITHDFGQIQNGLNQLRNLIIPVGHEFKLSDLKNLSEVLDMVALTNNLPQGWTTQDQKQLHELGNIFETASTKSQSHQATKSDYHKITLLSTQELRTLLSPLNDKFVSWTRVVKPEFWKWRALIKKKLLPNVSASYATLHSYIKLADSLDEIVNWFNSNDKVLSKHVNNPLTKSQMLKTVAAQFKTVQTISKAISENIIKKPHEILEISSDNRKQALAISEQLKNKNLDASIATIESAWSAGFVVNNEKIESSELTSVVARSNEVLQSIHKMHEWTILQSLITKCDNAGLEPFLKALEKISSKQAPAIFEKKFLAEWIEDMLTTNPILREFTGSIRQEKISRFKDLDAKIRSSMLKKIQIVASEPARHISGAQDHLGGEIGILRREMQKRKRFKPMRKLFAEIPHVLQAIKPCMLMSPISVSTFLKPGSIEFDLVVFDEASQLPSQEAIPAILRAKQVVVAGDENQLPPTSFFLASSIFEEEDEEASENSEPLESLLDDCVAIEPVFEPAKILWHYRSKDERLIKFSNNYFYNNSLITFPSASTSSEGRGVELVYTPDGTWDRGKSRTNRIEAKKVAEVVIQEFQKYPERSIGVVALNTAQKEAIENAIDDLITDKPALLGLMQADRQEPFFVKSLENVQGDERDTIIISVAYAKTPQGSLSLNFGPLNRDGGWRRLNVLVTRAKWHTILVTSIRSQELSAVNPTQKGAVMLRNFIEYAERGCKLPADETTLSEHETNDFEDSIAVAIRDRGLVVDEQVGASGYRIDLAIRDPRDKNRYIMAVECDGATYHSGRTARDRDMLRQQVLEDQGWKIHRVWSTDWFRDREKALNGILKSLDLAKISPVGESIQGPTILEASKIEELEEDEPDSAASRQTFKTNKKFKSGENYERFPQLKRVKDSKTILKESLQYNLGETITEIVNVESPIHEDVLLERLKEIYGINKAGSNIHRNVKAAIKIAVAENHLIYHKKFLYKNKSAVGRFRIPAEGVERSLSQISPEEIGNAILYLIEDQFGFAKEHIAKAVLGLFGLGRNWTEPTEIIELVVDRLIDEGKLRLSGYTLYLN